MFAISSDDTNKIQEAVGKALTAMYQGVNKVEMDIPVGEDIAPLKLKAYWVLNVLRIDIKETS